MLIITMLAATTLLAPLALAHSGAIVVQNDVHGKRCYVYNTHDSAEFWIETNGYLGDPSVPQGLALVNHVGVVPTEGSGLQRSAGSWGPADTQVDAEEWAHHCTEEEHDEG
ncbi:MAG: hypothetical protein WDA16_11680 [Candidatus Thermoplasmatota archaeon]